MSETEDYSGIAKSQCERTAEIYYAFRVRGGTANDLIEIPAMKRLIGDVRGKRVFDAGCGHGSYSIYCAKRGAMVTGVDISEAMIEIAEREAKGAGVRIDFRVGDVTNLEGIPPECFDIAISSCAVCFRMPFFFREMGRVLKPGGVFCFSDVHPIHGGGHSEGKGSFSALVVDRYYDRSIRKAKNVFGKLDPSNPDYEWQWEHYTLEDYCVALREAGFLIQALEEPQPDPSMKSYNLELYDRSSKYPIFILVRAMKGLNV
jgi:SAM-dependent methyltransferase